MLYPRRAHRKIMRPTLRDRSQMEERNLVVFHAIGQHENFYRDIQRRGGGEIEKPLEEG